MTTHTDADQFQITFRKPDGTIVPVMVDAELFSLIEGERAQVKEMLEDMEEDDYEEEDDECEECEESPTLTLTPTMYDSLDRLDMKGKKKKSMPEPEDMEMEEDDYDYEDADDEMEDDKEEDYEDSISAAEMRYLLTQSRDAMQAQASHIDAQDDRIDELEEELQEMEDSFEQNSWKAGIAAYLDAQPYLPPDFVDNLDSVESIAELKLAALAHSFDSELADKLDSEDAINTAYEMMKSVDRGSGRVDGISMLRKGVDRAQNATRTDAEAIRKQRMDEDYQRSRAPLKSNK